MIIETRITKGNQNSQKATEMGIIFQHEICGQVESRVTDGIVKYWADGIEGTTLVDAKFVKNATRSPFTSNTKTPSFIVNKVRATQVAEFTRVAQIVNSPNTQWDSFTVVTNSADAVAFFTSVAQDAGFSQDQFSVQVRS